MIRPAGKVGKYAEKEREAMDQLVVTSRCAFCPEWSFTGTAIDGRVAAKEHRAELHPDILEARRRRPRKGSRWTTQEQIDHSDTERRKRAFLLGIDLSGEAA